MLNAIEGSQAIAQAVALCRPQVVSAYPITPQTHIVENLSKLVANGQFNCEFVSVESEFSAASVALGAAMTGSRAYTASASQGILLMAEVLYNISGSRVPMVMTCANRAVSAPLSIWNDQQDSMAVRDAGWIQLYCADNQEAIDTMIQAYRIAERCELPVMVCVDGFTLTHTLETLDMPEQQQVDDFLPPYHFSRTLNPQKPISVGTLVSPDYYSEARQEHHQALLDAQAEIIQADQDWGKIVGREYGGLLNIFGDADAKIGILCLGSVLGTLEAALQQGLVTEKVKLFQLRCFRPFPSHALQLACEGLTHLVVLERALSVGSGGIVSLEVAVALNYLPQPPKLYACAAGLGGRDIPLQILPKLLALTQQPPQPFQIIDLK
jgi:pyruvate ferredoxin oxidoreductase alpha subunit